MRKSEPCQSGRRPTLIPCPANPTPNPAPRQPIRLSAPARDRESAARGNATCPDFVTPAARRRPPVDRQRLREVPAVVAGDSRRAGSCRWDCRVLGRECLAGGLRGAADGPFSAGLSGRKRWPTPAWESSVHRLRGQIAFPGPFVGRLEWKDGCGAAVTLAIRRLVRGAGCGGDPRDLAGDRRAPGRPGIAAREGLQRPPGLFEPANPSQQRAEQQLGLPVGGRQFQQRSQPRLGRQPVAGEIGVPRLHEEGVGGLVASGAKRGRKGR